MGPKPFCTTDLLTFIRIGYHGPDTRSDTRRPKGGVNMPHPTSARRRNKPEKPYPDFPLFAHATRRWAKKVNGKLHYFGPWDDPDGALTKYLEQKDALHAGRKPRESMDGTTVKDLCNAFLNAKAASRDAGELKPRTWLDYQDACNRLVSHFGKGRRLDDIGPGDFAELRRK